MNSEQIQKVKTKRRSMFVILILITQTVCIFFPGVIMLGFGSYCINSDDFQICETRSGAYILTIIGGLISGISLISIISIIIIQCNSPF